MKRIWANVIARANAILARTQQSDFRAQHRVMRKMGPPISVEHGQSMGILKSDKKIQFIKTKLKRGAPTQVEHGRSPLKKLPIEVNGKYQLIDLHTHPNCDSLNYLLPSPSDILFPKDGNYSHVNGIIAIPTRGQTFLEEKFKHGAILFAIPTNNYYPHVYEENINDIFRRVERASDKVGAIIGELKAHGIDAFAFPIRADNGKPIIRLTPKEMALLIKKASEALNK